MRSVVCAVAGGCLIGSLSIRGAALSACGRVGAGEWTTGRAEWILTVLPRTWRLLTQAVDVLLEATPARIDLDALRQAMLAVGVLSVRIGARFRVEAPPSAALAA